MNEPSHIASPSPQPHPSPVHWPKRLALLLFLAAGAIIASYTTRPLYRAQGLIQFNPPMSALNDDTFHVVDPAYIEGQAYAAHSATVADLAMASQNWPAVGRPKTPASKQWVLSNLSAQSAGPGLMDISFLDSDPATAANDCKAAQLAYVDDWKSRHNNREVTRLQVLRDRTSLIIGTINRLDSDLLTASKEIGGSDLGVLHGAQIQEVVRLEREIREAENPAPTANQTTPLAPQKAPSWLIAQYAQAKQSASATSNQMFKAEELRHERDSQAAELTVLQHRINQLTLDMGMHSQLSILSLPSAPTTPAIDQRPRNAALGALAALILFFILKAVWRNWQNRNRAKKAKTAFPVIITHSPKPVIPILPSAELSID